MKRIIIGMTMLLTLLVNQTVIAGNKIQHFILQVQYDDLSPLSTCFRSDDSYRYTCDDPAKGRTQAFHTYQHGPKDWKLSAKGGYFYYYSYDSVSGGMLLMPLAREVRMTLDSACYPLFNQKQTTGDASGTLEIVMNATVKDPCKDESICFNPMIEVVYSGCSLRWTPKSV